MEVTSLHNLTILNSDEHQISFANQSFAARPPNEFNTSQLVQKQRADKLQLRRLNQVSVFKKRIFPYADNKITQAWSDSENENEFVVKSTDDSSEELRCERAQRHCDPVLSFIIQAQDSKIQNEKNHQNLSLYQAPNIFEDSSQQLDQPPRPVYLNPFEKNSYKVKYQHTTIMIVNSNVIKPSGFDGVFFALTPAFDTEIKAKMISRQLRSEDYINKVNQSLARDYTGQVQALDGTLMGFSCLYTCRFYPQGRTTDSQTKQKCYELLKTAVRNLFKQTEKWNNRSLLVPQLAFGSLTCYEVFSELVHNICQCISFRFSNKRPVNLQEIVLSTSSWRTFTAWKQVLESISSYPK